MWAPKEISATLKVREVRYFIKHQFVGIPPPLPQGEGRQMKGGAALALGREWEEGRRREARGGEGGDGGSIQGS